MSSHGGTRNGHSLSVLHSLLRATTVGAVMKSTQPCLGGMMIRSMLSRENLASRILPSRPSGACWSAENRSIPHFVTTALVCRWVFVLQWCKISDIHDLQTARIAGRYSRSLMPRAPCSKLLEPAQNCIPHEIHHKRFLHVLVTKHNRKYQSHKKHIRNRHFKLILKRFLHVLVTRHNRK